MIAGRRLRASGQTRRGHSEVADHYAIPERLYAEGVRRYGFHGLSYEYIAERLGKADEAQRHFRKAAEAS